MTFEQAQKKSLILKKLLKKWNYEYYVNNNPSVNDQKYDQIMKKLITIEQKYNKLITNDSPTQHIYGQINKGFNKYIHTFPMLSLANAFNYDDLINFDKKIKELTNLSKIEYVCELKIDGLSISLIYDNYNLITGATRGDGIVGEDVTVNIKKIKSIPQKISQSNLIIRGEIYLSINEFNKINKNQIKEGKQKFSNTRNAAAGTLRQLNSSIVEKRKLNSFLYYYNNALENKIKSQYDSLKRLKQLKFKINPEYRYCSNISEVWKYIKEYEKKRYKLKYEIDGIVIKVNNLNLYNQIGYTTKNPKWAIAYKFSEKLFTTKLINIFPSVGRTGKITYNAILKPIKISGTIIKAATLYNSNFITSRDIRIGDYVQIKKAGDIIPKIINYIVDYRKQIRPKWKELKKCPECFSLLKRFKNEIDQYCINSICPKKIIKCIEHFCSKKAMNIKGINKKIIERLFKLKYLRSFSDLYELEKHKNKIIKLKNFGIKSFNNMINSINNSKNNSLELLIFGLGIRYVGKKIAKLLAQQFKIIDNLIVTKINKLIIINDIGPTIANSIINYFNISENKNELILLHQKGVKMKYIISNHNLTQKFENYRFVITGILSKPREYFKELIKNYGGKISEIVNIKTTYLLSGANNSTKLLKAKKLNIKIINEDEFKKLIIN